MVYLPLQHFQKRCLSVHIIIPCVQNGISYGPWSDSGKKKDVNLRLNGLLSTYI